MTLPTFTVKARIWLYPGDAAWHFVNIDKEQSVRLKERYGKQARGFRSLPVTVTLGKTTWDTSIFPDSHSGTYLLPLKASVRRSEAVAAGDDISFKVRVRLPR